MTTATRRPKLPAGLQWRGDTIHIITSINGRRVRRSTRTSQVRVARNMLDQLKGAIHLADLTGAPSPSHRAPKTLPAFITETLREMEADQAAPNTLKRYRGIMTMFNDFVTTQLQREPRLIDVTRDIVHEFKYYAQQKLRTRNGQSTGVGRPASPRTIANELDVVRNFMRRAVGRGLIKTNPEEGITRAKNAYQHRVRWLSENQQHDILHAAETWDAWHQSYQRKGKLLRMTLELFLRTGMRLGEGQHLTLDAIPPRGASTGYIHIAPRNLTLKAIIPISPKCFDKLRTKRLTNPGRYLPEIIHQQSPELWKYHEDLSVMTTTVMAAWKPKTSNRRIPVTAKTAALLEAIHVERDVFLQQGTQQAEARKQLGIPTPEWLIPDPSGLPWRWKMPNIMRHLSHRAGISPCVRTHDLRHTFATNLRKKGIALETIKELLGHADIKETMMYAHYQDDEGLRALELID